MHIAVASFQHETNTFSPHLTHYQDFEVADGWPGMLLGQQVIEELEGLNIACQGFIQAAREQGHQLTPINWCSAEPAGKVTDHAFETIVSYILGQLILIEQLDAIYLDLHGAMVSQTYFDGEGELLKRIRAQVGEEIMIVTSLDFHANVSADFVENVDQMAIYRTYPHLDMAATGRKCMTLLAKRKMSARKCTAFKQIPYLIALSSQHTGSSPIQQLFTSLTELEQLAQIDNIEFALGFPPADIPDSGPSICVFGSNQRQVDQVCEAFYQQVMAAEAKFINHLLSTEQALQQAKQLAVEEPVVIADVQDNPGAGGSADTTGILFDLVKANAKKAIITVLCDASVAQQAHQAGVAAQITVSLGAKGTTLCEPYCGSFEVMAISDGRFTCTGDMYAGCQVELGPSALLRVVADDCDIQVIVSSVRYACTDLAIFPHFGLEPTAFELLIVKSTVHFRAAFEQISGTILLVKSAGLHPCQLDKLNYQHLRSGVRLGPNGPTYLRT